MENARELFCYTVESMTFPIYPREYDPKAIKETKGGGPRDNRENV